MTAALGSSSAYYGAQVPFDVVVLLSDDVVDSNPASCDPDCRMVTLAVNIALSPPPVSNLELMSAMAVTLRGVPCKLNILYASEVCQPCANCTVLQNWPIRVPLLCCAIPEWDAAHHSWRSLGQWSRVRSSAQSCIPN